MVPQTSGVGYDLSESGGFNNRNRRLLWDFQFSASFVSNPE